MPFGLYFLLLGGRDADAMTSYLAVTLDHAYMVIACVDKEERLKEPSPCQTDILYERITS